MSVHLVAVLCVECRVKVRLTSATKTMSVCNLLDWSRICSLCSAERWQKTSGAAMFTLWWKTVRILEVT